MKIKLSAEVNKALMDKIESMKDLNKGQLILKDIRETDETWENWQYAILTYAVQDGRKMLKDCYQMTV